VRIAIELDNWTQVLAEKLAQQAATRNVGGWNRRRRSVIRIHWIIVEGAELCDLARFLMNASSVLFLPARHLAIDTERDNVRAAGGRL
jgi:hypothetical protein